MFSFKTILICKNTYVLRHHGLAVQNRFLLLQISFSLFHFDTPFNLVLHAALHTVLGFLTPYSLTPYGKRLHSACRF